MLVRTHTGTTNDNLCVFCWGEIPHKEGGISFTEYPSRREVFLANMRTHIMF